MNIVRITIAILIMFIVMMVSCIVGISLVNKLLVLKHYVYISVDDKTKLKNITEHFDLVTGMP